MTKKNKYLYLFVVQANYGYGWDDLTSTQDYKEAKADAKAYRENDSAPCRIIKRRVINK